ncbi:MAG: hypothetical protein JWN78_1084 [Bacteroidota bacterium]|nr:hypothetical protein [Bacteroidota bacterium]
MKKIFFLSIIMSLIFSCRKTTEQKNMILYNQPLYIIKGYIQGKWQIHYAIGGYSGHQRIDLKDTYIEFIFNVQNKDSIKWYNDTLTYANGPVVYHKALHFSGPDSTYVVELPAPAFDEWFFESFINDTLVVVQNSTESTGYMLTKAN